MDHQNQVALEQANNFLEGHCKAEYPDMDEIKTEEYGKAGGSEYQLKILGIPPEGTKSRVETQVKLCIQLVSLAGEKVRKWNQLKLPENLVVKEKPKASSSSSRLQDGPSSLPKGTLLLEAYVVCASDPTKQVTACFGCIQRERKRVKRKKEQVTTKSSSGFMSEPQSPEAEFGFEAESSAEGSGLVADQQKILLFNCSELVDFTSGDAILPTRLTCYCRHHNERVGFCVSFFIQDQFGNVLASAISPPIMITDDHKSAKTRGVKRQRTESSPVTLTSQQQPFFLPSVPTAAPTNSTTDQERSMRRYNLPLSPNSPPFSTNDSNTAAHSAHAHAQQSMPRDGFASNHVSDPHGQQKTSPMMFKSEPIDQSFDLSDQSYDHMSRDEEEELGIPPPEVARVVPTEGPLGGGIEVTVLGSNFYNGVHVMFGDNEAFSTHYWGPTTLICILPPSVTPGLVPVTIKENKYSQFTSPAGVYSFGGNEFKGTGSTSASPRQELDFVDSILNTDVVMFNYRDDTDKELMELALQVVGLKLTGRQEDAKQIAMAILNQVRSQNQNLNQQGTSTFNESRVIETLQTVMNLDTPFEAPFSLQTKTQQTMLHLATILNWPSLCAFLIQHGTNLDVTDRNEFTAMHFAAWLGRSQILKSLFLAGANASLKNAFGQTPKDMTHPKIAGIWDLMPMEMATAAPPVVALIDTNTNRDTVVGPETVVVTPQETSEPPSPPRSRSGSAESMSAANLSGDLSGTTFLAYTRPKIEKQRRRKRDRMIFIFWLPLMIVVVALVCFQFISAKNMGEPLQGFIGFELNA